MKINLPTKLTLLRIIIVPLIIFSYLATFLPYGKLIALILFIIAACTDFIDGYLARKNNQVTTLGKFLDPIADKLLVISTLLLVVVDKNVIAPYGVIFAIIIIGRDFFVSGLRSMAAKNNVVLAADNLGKFKTIVQDIALPAYLLFSFLRSLGGVPSNILLILEIVAFTLLSIATLLTIASGINYIANNSKLIRN
ncbi:MAG: CDP-diacylglycerol--glycerol-3-phosphate 3-phosphatidyltransferase [Clostridia bacterium]